MMKKAVTSAFGLILIVASAATASAASLVDCSGTCGTPCHVKSETNSDSTWKIMCFMRNSANDGFSQDFCRTRIKNDFPGKIESFTSSIDPYRRHRLEISMRRMRASGYKHFGPDNYYSDDDHDPWDRTSMVADFAYDLIRRDWGLIFASRLVDGPNPNGLISLRPDMDWGLWSASRLAGDPERYGLSFLGYWSGESVLGFTGIDFFNRAGVFDGLCHGYEWVGNCFGLVPATAVDWMVTTKWPWPTLNDPCQRSRASDPGCPVRFNPNWPIRFFSY